MITVIVNLLSILLTLLRNQLSQLEVDCSCHHLKKVSGHIFSKELERIYLFVIEFKFRFVALFFTSRVLECMSYSLDMLIVGR